MPALITDAITVFLGIIIEAIPFLLLGVLVSNIIKFFFSQEKMIGFVPKNRFLATLFGSSVGFFFPVCECGNVPVARQLILKKVKPYVAISFLLAAPVFNPIVIFATYVAFPHQPEIVFLRIVFSLFIAITIGLIFSYVKDEKEIVREQVHEMSCHHDHQYAPKSFQGFCISMVEEFLQMGGIMVVGAFLASASQAVFSRETILGIAHDPVTSIIAMMLLAAIISICSNVDAFFALAYAPTFSTAALLAFLVFGPMIDIKAVLMLRTIFTKKAIASMALLAFLLTFSITLFMNLNVS